MNKYIQVLILIMFFFNSKCCSQDLKTYKSYENEYKQVFDNFKIFINKIIETDTNITDTTNIKYILLNYVLSDAPLDTLDKTHFKEKEIPIVRMNEFVSQIKGLYQFFLDRSKDSLAQHLSAIPLRLSSDKCMYEKLTPFQRENTFVYFDDREPEKLLGYMLFVPKIKGKISRSLIWSWTLLFENGYWAFKTPMGEIGLEYFVSEGVKGPKPENRIGN